MAKRKLQTPRRWRIINPPCCARCEMFQADGKGSWYCHRDPEVLRDGPIPEEPHNMVCDLFADYYAVGQRLGD